MCSGKISVLHHEMCRLDVALFCLNSVWQVFLFDIYNDIDILSYPLSSIDCPSTAEAWHVLHFSADPFRDCLCRDASR